MKVLIVRFSSLGDVILSSVLLEPLYKRGAKIDFLTFKPFGELFKKDYRINKLIEIDKKDLKTLSQLKNLAKNLNKENYDIFIDIHNNLRTNILRYFLKTKTVKYKKNSVKRRLFINPYIRKVFKNYFKDDKNVIHRYLDTLKFLNIEEKELYSYRPSLILDEKDFINIKNFIRDRLVALGTGARYKNKIYPYYNKVAELLLDNGFNVALVGSKGDKILDKNVYPKEVIDLRGKLSLRESLALISKSIVTISNDSAIAHLSRAVKTPVLMIYGATHNYFGFYPLTDEGRYIIKNLHCQPCDLHGKKDCPRDIECLKIPPKFVLEEFNQLLK